MGSIFVGWVKAADLRTARRVCAVIELGRRLDVCFAGVKGIAGDLLVAFDEETAGALETACEDEA